MTVAKFLRWSGISFGINTLAEFTIPFPIIILVLAIVQALVGLYTERHNLKSATLTTGSNRRFFIKDFIQHLGLTFIASMISVSGEQVRGNLGADAVFLSSITFAILPNLRFIRADIISSKKAVCLAFIFLGIGHFYIGHSGRGSVLVTIGLILFLAELSIVTAIQNYEVYKHSEAPPDVNALLGATILMNLGIWIWQIFDVRSKSKQISG